MQDTTCKYDRFIEAVNEGNIGNVKEFMTPEYLEQKRGGWQPIHWACCNGDLEIVTYLHENQCDLAATTWNGWQPIHVACWKGHLEILKYLHLHKCDFTATDILGRLPMTLACQEGHTDIVKQLIEYNFDIERIDSLAGRRPIHHACENGHLDIVKLLLEHRTDMNGCDHNRWRPIQLACANGHVPIVKLLLQHQCMIENLQETAERSQNQQIIDLYKAASTSRLMTSISLAMGLTCALQCDHRSCFISSSLDDLKRNRGLEGGEFGQKFIIKLIDRTYLMKIVDIPQDKRNESYDNSKVIEFYVNRIRHCVRHDRVVQYYGATMESDTNQLAIFMEYVDGRSLDAQIKLSGILITVTMRKLVQQMLEGLHHLHTNDVIHGNIKPSNILLDSNGNIKLSDYGMAPLLMCLIKKEMHTNKYHGTLRYMAPEVIQNYKCTCQSDVWSVGIVMVEMLTGMTPSCDTDVNDGTLQYDLPLTIPPNVKCLIDQMLQIDPTQRGTIDTLLKCEYLCGE